MARDVNPILDPLRSALAQAVRSRVVGPDAERRASQLFDSPGERWFADERPIRTVHSDTAMFIGGLRALLFQSLHPLAMAGVAQHSDYRHDPWGRLQRTADFLAATTFGPADQAQSAVDRVKSVHTHVVGTTTDGHRYSANDPHLLKWVHLAEVDSFLASHQRFGLVSLSDADADRYVADMAVIADRLGVIDPPVSRTQLRHQISGYRPELRGTTPAREAARFLLLTPPLPVVARPAYGVIGAAAVSLLPLWARIPLRLPWLPIGERTVVRPAGELFTRTLRWALSPESPNRPAAFREVAASDPA